MTVLHEEDNHNDGDAKNNKAHRADTCGNLKRHILLVSLQL